MTRSAARLLPLLLVAALGGCDGPAPIPPLEEGTPPALRAVMFSIDEHNRAMEPVLRVPEAFEDIGARAAAILDLSGRSAFGEYGVTDGLFEVYRAWLRQGAETVRDGAAAGDVNRVRDGYVRMQQSCIACHKRYQPNH